MKVDQHKVGMTNIYTHAYTNSPVYVHTYTRTVRVITVGHRTISDQLQHLAEQLSYSPDKMSDRKKRAASSSLECPPAKKRNLTRTKSTVDRWITDNDKALSTSTWLKYDVDTAARGRVVALKCSVYCQFRDKLIGMRNYSAAYIEGSTNLRTSSFKDHAASEMHSRAMLLLKRQQVII